MSWTETRLPTIDKTVTRLGVAPNYGLRAEDLPWAADQGLNYWFWGPVGRFGAITPGLREVLKTNRDHHVVSIGGGGYFPWMVRWSVEQSLKRLGIEYVDVLLLSWLGVTSAYNEGILEEIAKLKSEGLIRAAGTSIHDRPRAARLAEAGPLDLFMLRYNAAHPGCEREVFPHLAARNPAVVAYTATSWGQLLKPKADTPPWPGRDVGATAPPMTAAMCYRFQLQNPHVHVALTGPSNRAQLQENLRALTDGPLEPDEEAWIRAYGAR